MRLRHEREAAVVLGDHLRTVVRPPLSVAHSRHALNARQTASRGRGAVVEFGLTRVRRFSATTYLQQPEQPGTRVCIAGNEQRARALGAEDESGARRLLASEADGRGVRPAVAAARSAARAHWLSAAGSHLGAFPDRRVPT